MLLPSLTDKQLGAAFRAVRESRGLRARDAASKAGVSQSYWSEIESGKRRLNERTVARAAHGFGIGEDALMNEIEGKAGAAPAGTLLGGASGSGKSFVPRTYLSDAPAPLDTHDDFRGLATAMVSALPRDDAWRLLDRLTEASKHGDTAAMARARALLSILQTLQPYSPP